MIGVAVVCTAAPLTFFLQICMCGGTNFAAALQCGKDSVLYFECTMPMALVDGGVAAEIACASLWYHNQPPPPPPPRPARRGHGFAGQEVRRDYSGTQKDTRQRDGGQGTRDRGVGGAGLVWSGLV